MSVLRALVMPNGYRNPTWYFIGYPTRFSFKNHRVAGNPKYRVLPEISGNTRSFGYYPKFSDLDLQIICELPENTRNTRNYPRVKKIPENTRSYFSTLLPDPNPTRYPVFSSIPDPTRFNFENHRVAGNPKYRVLPDISGKPGFSGVTRYFG